MEEKQPGGKLESFLYLGVFPLLFTVIFTVILLNILGIPVWKTIQDWGNKLPIVNYIIPGTTSAQEGKVDDSESLKQKYVKSRTDLKEKNQKIAKLNDQLSSNQQELKELKLNIAQLERKLETNQTEDVRQQMKKMIGIYENLPASKAAAMLEAMPLEDASLTISLLNQDQQSSILGSMKDAKKAAEMTMMMKEISGLNETDQTLLKEKIHEIALKQENQADTLSETIAGMPPAQSAGIIQSMMATNSPVAMNLMKDIGTTSRSQILTEIAKTDAKLAAQITANLNK